jgi:hypothetical protein
MARQLAARTGGTQFSIDVYCDDDSHSEIVWDVISFVIHPKHEPPSWGIYVETKRWRRGHGQQILRTPKDARVLLRGDHTLAEDEIASEPSIFDNTCGRVRYRLACEKCQRMLGQRRRPPLELKGEKLDQVLDRLALEGVSRISLAGLAARARV